MSALPQLLTEDVQEMDEVLRDLIAKTEARCAIITDKAGFRLAEHGDREGVDTTTLAALASNTFNATQAIAGMLAEPEFNCIYQQGEKFSLLVQNVDESSLVVVVFPANVSVGLVKYFLGAAIERIARQLSAAKNRAPGEALDLATLNIPSATEFFKRST